jgi:anti-sigma regulatory factor (Ser/Thr protein kinase)
MGVARRYTRGLLEMEGVATGDAELITSELMSNGLEHGGGETIELRVVGDDASVCIEVTDADGTNSTPRPCATTDTDK